MTLRPRWAVFVLILLIFASPASAQWTRVTDLPVTDVFSVWVKGDTITAGVDTAAYVSTNGGATWKRSAKVTTGVTSVEVVRVHKGRLYAGTIGQGMFVSHDLGDSWLPFNQGLTGGIANSHLFIKDLLVRGDSLFAATAGAGPWVRNLAAVPGSWSHFGAVFEPNQSSNMEAIASGGTRLFACAGANGTVYFRDPGQADWTLSWLNNVGIVAGLGALTSIWTGTGWVVGANGGVFRSALGQSPWTFTDVGLGTLFNASFAMRGPVLIAMFGTGGGSTIEFSRDDGATWQFVEDLPFIFTYGIATHGTTLYAARFDGLWRRSIANVSVPPAPGPAHLRFAVVGSQPVRGEVRFRFELPDDARAALDIFDLGGRRAGRIEQDWPAGSNEVRWDSSTLPAGVYLARLSVGSRSELARFVRVR